MRVSILVDDNVVVVDGQSQIIDCLPLIKQNIHAVQWYDTEGEVEYRKTNVFGNREPNLHITDFTPYQSYVDLWHIIDKDKKEEEERLKKQREEERLNAISSGNT
jgi:hypothetical protein